MDDGQRWVIILYQAADHESQGGQREVDIGARFARKLTIKLLQRRPDVPSKIRFILNSSSPQALHRLVAEHPRQTCTSSPVQLRDEGRLVNESHQFAAVQF